MHRHSPVFALLAVLASAPVVAQPALVADIRPGSQSSGPRFLTAVGDRVFFQANDGTNGIELFVSDGTTAGTRMVRDLTPGPGSTGFFQLTEFNGQLFFVCNTPGIGKELWRSDGTAAGTVLVNGDMAPSTSNGCDELLGQLGGYLYFSGDDGSRGRELFRTDGTAAGTTFVHEIQPGLQSSNPNDGLVVGNRLFFRATTFGSGSTNLGSELYVTDGTGGGTRLVKDIQQGSGSSTPRNFIAYGGRLWFSADDGTGGHEPWFSDGTTAGTQMLRDVMPGSGPSSPNFRGIANGYLFFSAIDTSGGTNVLWRTDGTSAGTQRVANLQVRSQVVELGNLGFVNLTDPTSGARAVRD